jgi:hypothetical protein
MRYTLKAINKYIEHFGYTLYKGKDYFYFMPNDPNDIGLRDSMVCVIRLNELTPKEWEMELSKKIVETDRYTRGTNED